MSLLIKPPLWCKNAVATKIGWADPKTGELLVAVKLDVEKIAGVKPQNGESILSKELEDKETLEKTEPQKEEVKHEAVQEDKPVKRRGRPAKKK